MTTPHPLAAPPLVLHSRMPAERLAPDHPVHAQRPASPLQVAPGARLYAPRGSSAYPGGETDMGPADG